MKGIFEDPPVQVARDEAALKWARADDAWEAITWTVSRDEACGSSLNDTGTIRGYIWDGARSADLPSVEIIYEIQATDIVIRDARFYDAPFYQHGRA
jgi:hypothetical protein